ncbi:MAG: P-loop NTPase fold protein [Kiritimatiellia bacterium]
MNFDEFRDQLAKLAGAIREVQNFPLVVIVDELDRCRPDFALGLIERIKHLFSTDNVSFVLLANATQLQNYMQKDLWAEC